MDEIDVLLRDLKKHGNADRDCALAAEDARAIVAALEAAREDACVALVADIRFACGDNGKRMQPELVEFIRGLARDAKRYRWLRDPSNYEHVQSMITVTNFGIDPYLLDGPELDAAIDQARGKENGNG